MTLTSPEEHDGCVVTLQNWINYSGADYVSVDGYFGPATYDGVIAFEKKYHLTVDGEVGPQVRAEIVLLNGGHSD